LSLNIDRSWRTFTTRVAPPEPGSPMLDCCTETADLALAYDRLSPIDGTDFCREMLDVGRKKAQRAGADGRGTLVEGDTQRLHVPSDTFGLVSVAIGLRNVRGTVCGIFFTPSARILAVRVYRNFRLFRFFSRHAVTVYPVKE
jgi:demethylmenaquinone methyltransferase / 2-methoxy-6-polyprenyl-1,4-benzoquinol methylase